MSDMGDRLIEYEESNYDSLLEKFMNDKKIREQWEDFIYCEFINNLPEPEGDR